MPRPTEIYKRRRTLATHRIRSLPVLVLAAHGSCDCRCVMCDIWKANRDRRELTRHDLMPHVNDLGELGVQRVVLSGGEALLHSNLWSLCRLIKELGARITLLSTGLALARNAAHVVDHCDEVIVSLDGSREVHDLVRRVPQAFDRLAAGVAALKDRRHDYRVTARCVLQRANFDDMPGTVDAAREIGLDGISFLAVDVSSTAFNRPTPWTRERVDETALNTAEVEAFRSVVERLIVTHAADFASGFVAERPDRLRRLVRYFAALAGDGTFPENVCNAPWVSAVIEADGTVRPCFFQPALGNLRERPLGEILNAPESIAFRNGLDIARDPICRKCVCTLWVAPHRAV